MASKSLVIIDVVTNRLTASNRYPIRCYSITNRIIGKISYGKLWGNVVVRLITQLFYNDIFPKEKCSRKRKQQNNDHKHCYLMGSELWKWNQWPDSVEHMKLNTGICKLQNWYITWVRADTTHKILKNSVYFVIYCSIVHKIRFVSAINDKFNSIVAFSCIHHRSAIRLMTRTFPISQL